MQVFAEKIAEATGRVGGLVLAALLALTPALLSIAH